MGHEINLPQLRRHLLFRQIGEQHATQRRAVGGQTAANTKGDRHDPFRRRTGDVYDRTIIEHGYGGRFAERLAHFLQHRLRGDRDSRRGEVRVTEVQDPRLQKVGASVGRRISQFAQGVEATSYNRTCKAGRTAHIGDRQASVDSRECTDDVQSARQRGHEVRIAAPKQVVFGVGGAHDSLSDKRTRTLGKCFRVQHSSILLGSDDSTVIVPQANAGVIFG